MISLVSTQGGQLADFISKIPLCLINKAFNVGVSNILEVLSI